MLPTRLALSGLVAGFLSVVVTPVATTPGAAAAEAVAAGCRGVNPALEAAFDTALALARTALEDQTLD